MNGIPRVMCSMPSARNLTSTWQHLTTGRASAPWWQDAAHRADAILLTRGKIKFERPDGTVGASPGSGVTLWAAGDRADAALCRAAFAGLGTVWRPYLAARKTA